LIFSKVERNIVNATVLQKWCFHLLNLLPLITLRMEFVRTYFNAEKAESLLFIITGIIALLVSLYFLIRVKKSFYTGLVFPLLFIGTIQLAVGTIIYLRSDSDKERVLNYMTLEPERINSEEIPRMAMVMKTFVYYRYIELAFIITGILLMFYIPASDLVKGIGMGLLIQASIILAADYFAERRGEIYLKNLRDHTPALYKQS
jgi:hypothetical protein